MTESNKLIAKFMGFIYPYKCTISRGGGIMEEVDLLSKVKFMTLPELLASDINNEAAPYYNNGGIAIGKYSSDNFYQNVIFFSTRSMTVPVTIKYNERFQAYHSSWDWLMEVVEKIRFIDDNQEFFFNNYYRIDFKFDFLNGVELWIDKERLFLQTAFGENQLVEAIYNAVIEFIKWYNTNKKDGEK